MLVSLVVEFPANGLRIIKDTVLFCVLIFNQYFSRCARLPRFLSTRVFFAFNLGSVLIKPCFGKVGNSLNEDFFPPATSGYQETILIHSPAKLSTGLVHTVT